MSGFLFALQFLTIIPIKSEITDPKKVADSLISFPIVGLLLSFILIGINHLLFILGFQGFISNIILILALTALTGSIHLDGLSDTFDALLSGKNKDRMLEIMRDPHIGVMGAISIISVLLLKVSFLSSLSPSIKNNALILMCVLSRWSLVAAVFAFPYARENGKAKIFTANVNLKVFLSATIFTLLYVLLAWGLKGLLVFIIAAWSVYLICNFINKKISGITGDTLGALLELNEVLVLLSCFLIAKI